MPATMAGSRGGTIGRTASSEWPEFIKRLLDGEVLFEELYERLLASTFPQNVTLVINNSCNLHCRHCYLQVKELTAPQLREEEWKLLIDSIASSGPELVCLSGKEIFLGDMGARLLSYLRETKDREGAPCRFGLITNGTYVQKFRTVIARAQPSYFDISLDGIEGDHEAIRGKGTFAQTLPNIEWGAKALGSRFFVNLTLQKQNYRRLVKAVEFLEQCGVQNISCGFYRPLPYTDSRLALTDDDVEFVLETLSDLESIALQHPLTVLLDLDVINLQPLKAFLGSRWFNFEDIRQDRNGECFVEHWLGNGVRLEARLAPYPTGVWRSVRITPEGNYLAAEDTINTLHYRERAIGNVRDFEYDFPRLHRHALDSQRFREILLDYYQSDLPVLIAACREGSVAYSMA